MLASLPFTQRRKLARVFNSAAAISLSSVAIPQAAHSTNTQHGQGSSVGDQQTERRLVQGQQWQITGKQENEKLPQIRTEEQSQQ